MESLDSLHLQSIIQQLRKDILGIWPCQTLAVNLDPILSLDEFHAHSCSPRHVTEQELRHHILGPNQILRRQLADSLPGLLRTLAQDPPEDLLLVCSGLVYAHGHEVGLQSLNELAMWRLSSQDLTLSCLDDLIEVVAGIFPRGMRLRTRRCERSYLVYGRGIEAYCGGWKWIGHCGLVNPMLLIESGFDPVKAHAVDLCLNLDRCVELQDKWDELCLRRPSRAEIKIHESLNLKHI